MKNSLLYYYRIKPETIHQINADYKCIAGNYEYLLKKVDADISEFVDIYNLHLYLLKNGFICHQIILNSENNIVTYINDTAYILLKINCNNREIDLYDVNIFANFYIKESLDLSLKRSEWYNLWTEKIDYIEYQVAQLGKNFPIIRNSINYYIGLSETAISLLLLIKNPIFLSLSHRRISLKSKTVEFYNPLNFILDNRVRDLSEFCKEKFFSSSLSLYDIKSLINNYNLNYDEILLFYIRLIFPTYYFDCYQEIILNGLAEKELTKYVSRANLYQKFLKDVLICLKKNYDLPDIDWLIKT